MNLEFYKKQALQKQKEHKKFLDSLKKKPPKNLDYLVEETHEEVFEKLTGHRDNISGDFIWSHN